MLIRLSKDKVVNEEGTRIILSDNTGVIGDVHYEQDPDNSTEYSLVTNTTGYTVEEGRASILLFPVGKKLGVEVDTWVEFDGYSPSTSTSWNAITTGDGVYRFWLVKAKPVYLIEDIEEGDVEENEVVYSHITQKFYRLTSGAYDEVELKDLIGTSSSSVVLEFCHMVKAGTLYTELVSKRVELMMRATCSDKDVTMVSKAMHDIEGGVYAMNYEYCKGNIINAIRIADYLNNKNYDHVLGL